ncbi:HPr(Ser) kinase/phosphatase [Alkaliphilus hydrothermalis]|uniref:HPr kinase/phosphorylase n=1 Tax=Alkaliphilus hydrothermalis TaxID=1482730 RepID=A0ABS2NMT4_9FIRM|nr:HPr(Ser) kinase/phosphatase [Alkaliphilus hydrothermalis]MBM7614231.1 HPr kinase/phosphorylase [Alkaliphilus hydrothermalis]
MTNGDNRVKSITVKKMIEDLKLEEINCPPNEIRYITTTELNRPGIQLAGFFHYFAYERIQLIGKVEHYYLNTLSPELRQERFDRLLSYDLPCIIISRDLEVHDEMLVAAEKYKRKILRSSHNTTKLISKLVNYLEDKLAPTVTLHGVLMDIYGVGILITGKSGIGKSETAVELIKRGHLLVADDSVEIKKIGNEVLIGTAPELIRHMMEVRGIGLMDIKSLFGVGAIKEQTQIDMVVHLEEWDSEKAYDRLGLEDNHREILEIKVNEVVIPIKPARNIALLIEVAARNCRQKEMGYHAAKEFDKRLMDQLSRQE